MESVRENFRFLRWIGRAWRDYGEVLRLYRSSKSFVSFVVAFAIFADQFVVSITVPVLPVVLHDHLGVPEDNVQMWISRLLSTWGIANLVVSPFCGWLSDKLPSRRLPFISGPIAMVVAILVMWLSKSLAVQLVSRAIQGVAAAIAYITGMAIMADTVGPEEIGKYSSYAGIGLTIGGLLGPLCGGLALGKSGYSSVLITCMSVVGVDLALRLLVLEKECLSEKSLVKLQDSCGWCKSTTTLVTDDSKKTHHSNATTFPTPPGLVRKFLNSMPPVIMLLTSSRVLTAMLCAVVAGTVDCSFETVLCLQLAQIFGWGPMGCGLAFIPLAVPALAGPFIGNFCDRRGARWPAFLSLACLCPAVVLLRLVDHDSYSQKVLLYSLLSMIGLCITGLFDAIFSETVYAVEAEAKSNPTRYLPSKTYAQAYGLINTFWVMGDVIGPLGAGKLRENAGWGTTMLVLGAAPGITAIPTLFFFGGWLFRKRLKVVKPTDEIEMSDIKSSISTCELAEEQS